MGVALSPSPQVSLAVDYQCSGWKRLAWLLRVGYAVVPDGFESWTALQPYQTPLYHYGYD